MNRTGTGLSVTAIRQPSYVVIHLWDTWPAGRSTRRRQIACVRVPAQEFRSPSELLRLLADELERDPLDRWQPPA